MEEQVEEYQTPEVFDLGAAAELTFGRHFGTWPDGLDGWTFEF
jgi:hypothetical protein